VARPDADASHLRALLRDLVALSAIPALWIEREHERLPDAAATATAAVATGLADALAGLLELDFVFVRLRDPDGAGAVDVARGNAWKGFPEWLQGHLAASGELPRKELVPDVDGGSEPCHGLAIPIGLDGEGGLIAAGCGRTDFPSATEQLLLSFAANQAATAFQSACLIHERRRAEEALRQARNQLEVKVAERTAELERSRAELAASRARIVTAADETRRRIARDLHDGVQQQLVTARLQLRAIEAATSPTDERRSELARVESCLAGAREDLVEISRGIHPAVLTMGGLAPALRTLAARSPVPVELELRAMTRLPEPVEVAAYYVVSEALTNIAKHADASSARVDVEVRDGVLELSIRDDGRGGADAGRGSGLIGLADRVDALEGTIDVESPVGKGTRLRVTLPIARVWALLEK
jgi:signal transduction histidine kinase